MALRTTTHSARRTLWSSTTSQSVKINHHGCSQTNVPIPASKGRSGVHLPNSATRGQSCAYLPKSAARGRSRAYLPNIATRWRSWAYLPKSVTGGRSRAYLPKSATRGHSGTYMPNSATRGRIKAGLNDDLRNALSRFKRRSALRSRSRLLGRQQMAPLVRSPKNFHAGSCGALLCRCAL